MKRNRNEKNDETQENSKRQNIGSGLYAIVSNIGKTIYNAFTSTPMPEGAMTQVPDDIRLSIMRELSFENLRGVSQVSKNFNYLSAQFFNHYLSSIPKHFNVAQPNLSPQQKLLCFSHARDAVSKKFYPKQLIDILGLDNFVCFSNIKKNTMRLYAKVQSSKADEGKIVSVKYAIGYSRMTDNGFLCSTGNLLPHNTNERIPGTGSNPCYWPHEATAIEYLSRLAKGEPCGEVIDNIEQPLKTTPEGLSIVRLCDKEGNILKLVVNNINKKLSL